ncbi:MAG: hypothetical protein J4G04_06900 [Nitrosopumilaceae archaeon]|nr:hypothetical protein [Nitrosopumilaceae archaeon]
MVGMLSVLVAAAIVISPALAQDPQPHESISPAPVASLRIVQDAFSLAGFPDDMETFAVSDRTYLLSVSWLGTEIVDVTDPKSPSPVADVFVDQDTPHHDGSGRAGIFSVSNHTYALVAVYDTLQIINVTIPDAPTVIASIRNGHDNIYALRHLPQEQVDERLAAYQGVRELSYSWGQISDVETFTAVSGSVYALLASQGDERVQVIDVTSPDAPILVSSMQDSLDGFYALDEPADVEVFDASGRTYALVFSFIGGTMQVIDLTSPDAPMPAADIRNRQHSWALVDAEIFAASGRTYALTYGSEGLQIIDVTEPSVLVPVAGMSGGYGRGDPGKVEVFDVSGRTYALTHGSEGLQIIDVTEPSVLVPVASMPYEGNGLPYALDMEVFASSGSIYALVANYADNVIQVIDVTEPATPEHVGDMRSGTGSWLVPEIAAVDVEVFASSGSIYALVADAAGNAIRAVNITEPATPEHVGDIPGGPGDFYALSSPLDIETFVVHERAYALVASGKYGAIQVLDVTDPRAPAPVTEVWDGSGSMEIFTLSDKTYAFLMSGNSAHIINVTEPAAASTISGARSPENYPRHGNPVGTGIFSVSGNTYAITPDHYGHRVQIVDITDAGAPEFLDTAEIEQRFFYGFSNPLDIETFYAYGRPYALVTGYNGFDPLGTIQIIDLARPQDATYASTILGGQGGFGALDTPTDAEVFGASGRTYALVLDNGSGPGGAMHIVDVTNPDDPVTVHSTRDGQGVLDAGSNPGDAEIFVADGTTYAAVADADGSTLWIIALTAQDS